VCWRTGAARVRRVLACVHARVLTLSHRGRAVLWRRQVRPRLAALRHGCLLHAQGTRECQWCFVGCLAHPRALPQGRLERDKSRRDALFHAANEYVVKASGVEGGELLPWLARGSLALARSNVDEATKSFQAAAQRRDQGAHSTAPLLGLACCAFAKGGFAEALRLFGTALRSSPQEGPGAQAARLGLGACHLRLGALQRARAAFARAQQVNNGGASQLGLALCDAAAGAQGAPLALAQLQRAYAEAWGGAQRNPTALLLLSEHSQLCGQQHCAEALARAAAEASEAPLLRCAASLQLGRLAHQCGRAEDAQRHYAQALSHAPSHPHPHIGMAQICLARDELRGAAQHLERAAVAVEGIVVGDTAAAPALLLRRLLAHAHACSGDPERQQKAAELLRAAIATKSDDDAGAFAELAQLLHSASPSEALALYGRAIARRAACGQPPHCGLHNNAALLVLSGGDTATAKMHYATATAAARAGDAWVVAFNRASLEEDETGSRVTSVCDGAQAPFNQRLLQEGPPAARCDVLLRRAHAAAGRGDLAGAELDARAASELQPESADAAALLGCLAILGRDYKRAQHSLDAFRKQGDVGAGDGRSGTAAHAQDDYLSLCQANALLLDAARGGQGQGQGEAAARRENRLERSLALFSKTLARSPRNLFAAHGCACVLAERGRFAEAALVFGAVAEGCVGGPGNSASLALAAAATLHAAHCHLGRGDAASAVRLYDQALRRRALGPAEAAPLLCRARALHECKGEGGAEAQRLALARASLLAALHWAPGLMGARFDAAFLCQEAGVRCLQRLRELPPGSDGRLAAAQSACVELQLALRLFRQLLAVPEPLAKGFQPKRASIHAAFCADALLRALQQREHAVAETEATAARRSAQQAERASQEALKARLVEASELQRQAEEAAVEAEAQRVAQRLQTARQRWTQRSEGGDEKGGRRREARKGPPPDEEEQEQEDATDEPQLAQEGRRRAKRAVEDEQPIEEAPGDGEQEVALEGAQRKRLRKAGAAELDQPAGDEADAMAT